MRSIRLLFALAGAVALAGAPMQVQAQSCVAPISWGTTYAYETSYAANLSAAGSKLTLVGSVNCFSGIFSGNMPIPAGKEYTVYIWDLTSLGTTVTNVPGPATLLVTSTRSASPRITSTRSAEPRTVTSRRAEPAGSCSVATSMNCRSA